MSLKKEIAKRIIKTRVGPKLVSLLHRIGRYFYHQQNVLATEEIYSHQRRVAKEIFADKFEVLRGPFKGLKYPDAFAIRSVFLPKLIGCYEAEIYPVIKNWIKNKNDYSKLINIGCAEGFYAVGIASKMPNIDILVFDMLDEAIEKVKKLAIFNNISLERFEFQSECTLEKLQNIDLGEKPFVICDCDGCEKHIFTKKMAQLLSNAELIIELHGHYDVRNSTQVIYNFLDTHNLQLIQNRKKNPSSYPELKAYSQSAAEKAITERRDGFHEWAYLTPKADGNG